MSLSDGGHLTHGAKVNFSGKLFNAIQYGLNNETGEVDYNQVEAQAKEHQPKMIVAGFSAYSRVMDWQRFRDIADSVGAYLFVDMAHVAGYKGLLSILLILLILILLIIRLLILLLLSKGLLFATSA